MQVVCRICKNKIDKNSAYCLTDCNNKNTYYCSKEEYDNYQAAKQQQQQNLKIIVETYQYLIGFNEPSYGLSKTLLQDEVLKDIPIETIAAFMTEFKEKIKRTIEHKINSGSQFKSPWAIGKYINAILAREIIDKQWKAKIKNNIPEIIKKAVDIEFYGSEQRENKRRISLDELEDLVDDR